MPPKKPTETNVLELIGDLLDLLGGISFIDYSKPLDKMSSSMKYAIAQFYSTNELRSYMEYKISENTRNSAEKGNDPMAIAFNRGRLSMLKEIVKDGKECFENAEKLKPLAARLNEQRVNEETVNHEKVQG